MVRIARDGAGGAHGRGQVDLFPWPERRADDRHVDAEQVAERVRNMPQDAGGKGLSPSS
jgi:hypothetical protein